jgi:hypothetical protein
MVFAHLPFPAHQNDEPYHHHDGHHEEAHSKTLRNLRDVDAPHGQSLVERRQPHQARVYRKQIRPVVMGGAEVMDSLFPRRDADA